MKIERILTICSVVAIAACSNAGNTVQKMTDNSGPGGGAVDMGPEQEPKDMPAPVPDDLERGRDMTPIEYPALCNGTCTADQVCCLTKTDTGADQVCTTKEACSGGIAAECGSPEACPGQICCANLTASSNAPGQDFGVNNLMLRGGSASCKATCEGSLDTNNLAVQTRLCNTNSDCPTDAVLGPVKFDTCCGFGGIHFCSSPLAAALLPGVQCN